MTLFGCLLSLFAYDSDIIVTAVQLQGISESLLLALAEN